MHHRKKYHAVGATERIESPVITDRIYIRIPDSAFLKKFSLGCFQRCLSIFDMTALGFLSIPLLVL